MYIGLYKIKEEKPFTHITKTAKGEEIPFEFVEVSFKTKKDEEVLNLVFPLSIMDDLKTKKPTDYNFIRDVRHKAAAEAIQAVFLKYEIGIDGEMQDVLRFTQGQFSKTMEKMEEKRWGKPLRLVSMRDVDIILMK